MVSHVFTYSTRLVAEKKGLPWAAGFLLPLGFFSACDPPVLPQIPFMSKLRFLGPAFHSLIDPDPVYLAMLHLDTFALVVAAIDSEVSIGPNSLRSGLGWLSGVGVRIAHKHGTMWRRVPQA